MSNITLRVQGPRAVALAAALLVPAAASAQSQASPTSQDKGAWR